MQELGVDYTLKMKYVTEQKSNLIMSDDNTIYQGKRFDYKRLFDFINFDLSYLSEDLLALYNRDPNNLFELKTFFDKINKHINKIFGFSNFAITRFFIQTDYIEHIKHMIYTMQSLESVYSDRLNPLARTNCTTLARK